MAKPLVEIFESFTNVMELLRNPEFQDMLENYERAKKTFIVGYEVQDDVTSELLFAREGSVLKPEDYLLAFSEFIKNNETQINAIGYGIDIAEHSKIMIERNFKAEFFLNSRNKVE